VKGTILLDMYKISKVGKNSPKVGEISTPHVRRSDFATEMCLLSAFTYFTLSMATISDSIFTLRLS
jgi:hypothetical protein